MADRGYVLLWRKFWDSQLFKTSQPFSEREAWLYLFSNLANGIERNGVPRGQFEASRHYLAKKWGWAESHVYRFLRKLESESMIMRVNKQSDKQTDRFIVCNYETYQTARTSNRTSNRTTITKEGLNECKKKGNRATALPIDFTLTDDMEAWAKENFPNADLGAETAHFIDHHTAKGSTFKDWEAAWRTWIRRSKTYGRQPTKVDSTPMQTDWILDTGRTHGKPSSRPIPPKSDGYQLPAVQAGSKPIGFVSAETPKVVSQPRSMGGRNESSSS